LRDNCVQARRAISDGVPLIGHYVRSLLDSFEWAEGYEQRGNCRARGIHSIVR
jgi:beta-glucosidase